MRFCKSEVPIEKPKIPASQKFEAMWLILHSQPVHIFCVAFYLPAIGEDCLYENRFSDTVEKLTCFHPQAHFTICGNFDDIDASKVVQQLPITDFLMSPT